MFLLLFLLLSDSLANPIFIDKRYAENYLGNEVSICDKVSYVSVPDKPMKPYIIYFEEYGGKFSDNNYLFNGIIWSNSLEALEISPKADLSGKDICISGVVSSYNGTPQIVVSRSEQISIVYNNSIGVR